MKDRTKENMSARPHRQEMRLVSETHEKLQIENTAMKNSPVLLPQ